MRKVEHAQHAEDDSQAARHHKQQQSVQHAVERGGDDQFKHDTPSLEGKSRVRRGSAGANDRLREIRAYSTKINTGQFA
jgi:hypothetical protein